MSDEAMFRIASSAPMLAWLALVASPLRPAPAVAFARAWCVALAIGYVVLIGVSLAGPGAKPAPDLTTLAGLAALFAEPRGALIGWVHFLALDLWTGAWEAEDASRTGVRAIVLVPCLALTLLAGPAGLLLYLALRTVGRRRAPAPGEPRGPRDGPSY